MKLLEVTGGQNADVTEQERKEHSSDGCPAACRLAEGENQGASKWV